MTLPRLLIATAVAALALPAAAQAAPPWSDPVTVPGSPGQAGSPVILGDAVTFNGAGSFPGAPLLRAPLDASATAARWPGATDFDAQSGAFAAGDAVLYVGSNGHRRVNVALAADPSARWRVSVRGPRTGGARVAAAPGAAVFSTFESGGSGRVYVVRQTGASTLGPTQRLSGGGHIRSVAVATNARGDALVAWDRSGTIEARFWYARSKRLSAVQKLGETNAALRLSVALGADRRAIVAWVDQGLNEGSAGAGSLKVVARTATRGFSAPKPLESYPVDVIPGGTALQTAYDASGRGVIAWSGLTAVRAAFVTGRTVGAPQDVAPIAPDPAWTAVGVGDLVTSPAGQAVLTLVARADADRTQILAAPLAAGAAAFGPAEVVAPPEPLAWHPTAAFAPGSNAITVAWGANRSVEVSQRPAP
jgi:hypothetical protein